MNSEEHALIGGTIGFLGYMGNRLVYQKPINLIALFLSTIGGAGAAVLPDLLEPADDPNHRSIFHSVTTLLLLTGANIKTWENKELTEDQKLALSILSTAYESHLIADSTTKKSLPLLF